MRVECGCGDVTSIMPLAIMGINNLDTALSIYLCNASVLELETKAIRRFAKVSIVSYSRPSLMIIASASKFHVYLPPWGQRPCSTGYFLVIRSQNLMEDENPKVSNTWLDGLVIYTISLHDDCR